MIDLSKYNNSDEYQKAYELWVWYGYTCEMYDRLICTGGYDLEGFIKPYALMEHAFINKNAKENFEIILQKARECPLFISYDIWQKAKQDVSRLTWMGLIQEYNRLWLDKDD